MTPAELAMACKASIESGSNRLVIEMNRKAGGSERVYLAGRGSPRGKLLCENARSRAVVQFDAIDVLAWLTAHGFVKVVTEVKEQC